MLISYCCFFTSLPPEDLFVYLNELQTETNYKGETDIVLMLIHSQITSVARSGPVWSHKLAASSRLQHGCEGESTWTILCYFPRYFSRGAKQLGFILAPIYGAGAIVCGSTHCIKGLTPSCPMKKRWPLLMLLFTGCKQKWHASTCIFFFSLWVQIYIWYDSNAEPRDWSYMLRIEWGTMTVLGFAFRWKKNRNN